MFSDNCFPCLLCKLLKSVFRPCTTTLWQIYVVNVIHMPHHLPRVGYAIKRERYRQPLNRLMYGFNTYNLNFTVTDYVKHIYSNKKLLPLEIYEC